MTIKHLSLSLLVATLAFVGCKKDDDPTNQDPNPNASLILPGEGTTELKVGAQAQTAIDLYGTPSFSNLSANGVYTHILSYLSKGVDVYCEPTPTSTFNPQMKIASLSFTAPFDQKTEKGIGIGSSKTAVKAAYGDPISSSVFFGDEYAIGITFVYENDLVETINVEVANTTQANLILPGVGITQLKIGDEAQKAIDLYGVPFPSNASANGIYTHFLVYVAKGVTVYCEPTPMSTFNPQMKIDYLRFSAPFDQKTAKGIGVGSSKTEVKAAYGDPVSSNAVLGDKYAIGITFIYQNDLVKTIEVKEI
jgi:hypothetical protein